MATESSSSESTEASLKSAAWHWIDTGLVFNDTVGLTNPTTTWFRRFFKTKVSSIKQQCKNKDQNMLRNLQVWLLLLHVLYLFAGWWNVSHQVMQLLWHAKTDWNCGRERQSMKVMGRKKKYNSLKLRQCRGSVGGRKRGWESMPPI